MVIEKMIVSSVAVLKPGDSAGEALKIMHDNNLQFLPIVENEKYLGAISEEDLLELDENAKLSSIQNYFLPVFVKEQDHVFAALKIIARYQVSIIPVVNDEKEFLGTVSYGALLQGVSVFLGVEEPGAIIVLAMDKIQYSFGELSRLVETNDAYITQLNTHIDKETNKLQVTIKINKFEVSDVIATFQRYDYTVLYYFGEELYRNELKDNYDLLMTYLKM